MLRAAFLVLLPRLFVLSSLLIHSGIVVVVALRMTSLQIPEHVMLNETVHLKCDYEMDNSQLYAVQWYKDGQEFYRYTPKYKPKVNIFPTPGVNVNKLQSNQSFIVLNNVNLTTTGRYRCEISCEAPNFETVSDHRDMTVVVLPNEGPQITGGRSKYQLDDVVRMNCTSAPSKPHALLSWFINDEPADSDYLRHYHPFVDENGLDMVTLGLEFCVENKHFKEGDMKLRCLATITTVYKQSNEESATADESVTADESRQTSIMEDRETRAQSHTREDILSGAVSVTAGWTILVAALVPPIAIAR